MPAARAISSPPLTAPSIGVKTSVTTFASADAMTMITIATTRFGR